MLSRYIPLLVLLAACVVEEGGSRSASRDSAGADTLRTESVGGTVSAGSAAGDTAVRMDTAGAGMAGGAATTPVTPAPVTTPSATGTPAGAAVAATRLRLLPDAPSRGEALVAVVEGAATDSPRCLWDGERIPCRRGARGIEVIVPIPVEGEAETISLVVDTTGGSVTRDVSVRERNYGRELVFLDPANWKRVQDRAEVARDARRLRRILSATQQERLWEGGWREPVEARQSGGFGAERFYFAASDSERAVSLPRDAKTTSRFAEDTATGRWSGIPSWRHAGVDYAAARGSAVIAPARGVVAEVGNYTLTGRTVILDHGDGVMTGYFHLDSAMVRRGDEVAQGRTLGRVGSTGLSTGPHLHYGVYVRGVPVDPASWRQATESLAAEQPKK